MSLKLKLNLNTGVSKAPSLTTPQTPSTTPGGSKAKIKFKTKSTPATPAIAAAPKPQKTKAGRAPKPSAKAIASRKRDRDGSDSDDDGSTIAVHAPPKKVKLSFGGPKTPLSAVSQTPILLKPKLKGKPPKRNPGEGYDSEASDREIDPTIEEEFVLRLMDNDDCDYLRNAINEKRIGIPVSQGGANIQMKFFHGEGRRGAVTIKGRVYAATMVDLPCVIEGMKSWDKRGWWKSADICQMFWVFARVEKEEEARTIPLPDIIADSQYPHGITPPMHYARKRRFRKGISRSQIEAVEDQIEQLLKADAVAQYTRFEMIDPDAGRASQALSPGAASSQGGSQDGNEYSEDEDAEGEADDDIQQSIHQENLQQDYFGEQHDRMEVEEDDDFDLEGEIEAELLKEEAEIEAQTPMSTSGATPFLTQPGTPAAVAVGEEDSGDESIEGDDEEGDDGDDSDDMDEDEKARLAQIEGTKEDIADLNKQLEDLQVQWNRHSSQILKKRVEESIRKVKAELEVKKSSIGMADD